MAKKVNTVITDDLDGSPDAEAVTFSVNDQAYEIDLGPANQERFRASLQPFIDAGRRTGQKRPRRARAPRADLAAIRSWAQAQGLQIAERGRISADVVAKYDVAHQN